MGESAVTIVEVYELLQSVSNVVNGIDEELTLSEYLQTLNDGEINSDMTLFGCLTIVRVYKPKVKDDGTVDKKVLRRVYFFVHDDELRNAYDTYEKIKRLTMKGYKSRSEQLGLDLPPVQIQL